jgi:hypothetical protein
VVSLVAAAVFGVPLADKDAALRIRAEPCRKNADRRASSFNHDVEDSTGGHFCQLLCEIHHGTARVLLSMSVNTTPIRPKSDGSKVVCSIVTGVCSEQTYIL